MAGQGSSGKGIRPKPARASSSPKSPGPKRQQVIPEAVANRMARRIALATGVPTLMGMGVFIGSYLLVVVGLSYGVLSASWEDAPGSLLGTEQIGLNISRLRSSIQAMRNTPPR